MEEWRKKAPYVLTASGGRVDLIDPMPEQIKIGDISWSLSNINRWSGNTRVPISVGWHSIQVAEEAIKLDVSPTLSLLALLHDAHEAYIGDIPQPAKKLLKIASDNECGCSDWDHIEQSLDRAILDRLGYTPAIKRVFDVAGLKDANKRVEMMFSLEHKIVSALDALVARQERQTFCTPSPHWQVDDGVSTFPAPPPAEEVRAKFEALYLELLEKARAWVEKERQDVVRRVAENAEKEKEKGTSQVH